MKKLVALAVFSSLALFAGSAHAITYGTPTGNSYGNVGGLVGPDPWTGEPFVYCTGTLISPTVLLTAAHRGTPPLPSDIVGVTFDPVFDAQKSKLHCGTFIASPYYAQAQDDPNDLAVVVFDKPIHGIQPATIATEGYLDELRDSGQLTQDTEFISVGYGDTEFTNAPGGPTNQHLETRMYAVGRFNALGPGYLRLTQNQATGDAGTCNGDSGGPIFYGVVLVAVTSTGDTLCKSTNVGQRIDTPESQEFLSQYV
jgi:secreted trypsin-like serine protease